MAITPEGVVTDGGAAFISEQFRFACADLGITKEVATAGFPEMRGHIERFFRTIAFSLMPMLSGRTFSNSVMKGSANPEKRAALTVDDLMFALTRWIVDIYHNEEHLGLNGETPAECWKRKTAEYGVNPPPDARQRRSCFGTRLTRSLGKEGVRILKVKYHSEQLARFMNRIGECEVDVRWSSSDVGAIDVRCGDDWFEVPPVNLDLRNTSAQVLLAGFRRARADNPRAKALNRKTIHNALSAISGRNAAAIETAGILLEDWSAKRIEFEEDEILSGFEIADEPGSALVNDGSGYHGASITDEADDDQPAAIPLRNSSDETPWGIN